MRRVHHGRFKISACSTSAFLKWQRRRVCHGLFGVGCRTHLLFGVMFSAVQETRVRKTQPTIKKWNWEMQWIKMLQFKGNPYVSKCFPNDPTLLPWVVQGRETEWVYRLDLWYMDFPKLQLCLRCGMTLVPGVGALTLGEWGWKNGSSPFLPQAQCVGSQLWTANWTCLLFQNCSLHSQKSACYCSSIPWDHT